MSAPVPVFTPDNEPYLGSEDLTTFDLTIPRAMQFHRTIGSSTFGRSLSPIQTAATVIIPQGVSIALSIRELIRQAYLLSGAILLRPLVERAGMIQYLAMHPAAVESWHSGWPRKSQPNFQELVELVTPDATEGESELTKDILHKLVHIDPKSAIFNIFQRDDGSLAFASGKELDQPKKADAIASLACHCLRRLTTMSVYLFPPENAA